MRGDLDDLDGGTFDEGSCERFLAQARALLRLSMETADATPDLQAYMDRLFADSLARCIADAEREPRLLTLQPIVFARLAGFLASHGAPEEDPLRQVIEALMLGYAESDPGAGGEAPES